MLEFLQEFMECFGFLMAYLWNYCRSLWIVGIFAGVYGMFWIFDGLFYCRNLWNVGISIGIYWRHIHGIIAGF